MFLWLRTVNAALYLAACSLMATGLALEWKVEIEDESRTLLGMTGEDWGELHFILALVVMGLVVVHLALHWAWIKNLLTQLRWPTLVCLVIGGAVIALVLAAPVSGAHGPGLWPKSHDDRHHRPLRVGPTGLPPRPPTPPRDKANEVGC